MKKISTLALLLLVALSIAPPRRVLGEAYEEGLEKLLPVSGAIEGWERDGEPLVYYADNLWEYINGAAEGFLAYGVKAVIAQDYVDGSGAGLKLEVYDHETPLMGFGIYSQHRGPGLQFLEVGTEAFGDEYSLQCWKDRYYVRINVYEAGDELSAAMMSFAEAVTGAIPGEASFPPELDLFPEEGLAVKSLTYLTEGVLGRGRLPRAFAGEYELGGGAGRLYLFPAGDPGKADALADWYAGETEAALSARGAGGARYRYGTGADPYQGEVAIFTCGSWAGVVTGFENNPAVRLGLVERAVDRLAGAAPLRPPVIDKIESGR